MKALSVNQPWAWCLVNGYKPVENRDWETGFRGLLLIHAGLKFDDDGYEFIKRTFPCIPLPPKDEIDRGGIVGHVNVVDCVSDMESPWFFGKYGFVITDAQPCTLIPCKGALGLFKPDYNSRYVEKKPKEKKTIPEENQRSLFGED